LLARLDSWSSQGKFRDFEIRSIALTGCKREQDM
jgi:hypothetical protein